MVSKREVVRPDERASEPRACWRSLLCMKDFTPVRMRGRSLLVTCYLVPGGTDFFANDATPCLARCDNFNTC
jgi:hypothetical protein